MIPLPNSHQIKLTFVLFAAEVAYDITKFNILDNLASIYKNFGEPRSVPAYDG